MGSSFTDPRRQVACSESRSTCSRYQWVGRCSWFPGPALKGLPGTIGEFFRNLLNSTALLAPNSRLSPSKFVEFIRTQRCLCGGEEFVELRRWHGGAGEHRVRLTAMMNLMLEQVQQEAVGTLRLDA